MICGKLALWYVSNPRLTLSDLHLCLLTTPSEQIYTLFYDNWPFFDDGFHPFNFYICTLVEKLGPLPSDWDAQWDKMIAGDKELEDESKLAPADMRYMWSTFNLNIRK